MPNMFNLEVSDNICLEISQKGSSVVVFFPSISKTVLLNNSFIIPGLSDVHVHLREPGFSYKETIKTGSIASAAGGFTTVLSMPNLNPVPDSVENLKKQLEIIEKDACINVLPFGSITVGEKGEKVSDIEGLKNYVCGYSDDGCGIRSREIMLEAMQRIKAVDKVISCHSEDYRYSGGIVHMGDYAKRNNLKGIPSECEWKEIERDIELADITKVKYHICHISSKESVSLIRQAKKSGIDVTAETCPHYFLLNDSMLKNEGRFKMAPPIREEADRLSVLEGLIDGTIDMIATDHAPHSIEEKSKGLLGSLNGVSGIEIAFPLAYEYLVKSGLIDLYGLISLMSDNPNKRFSLSHNKNDFAIIQNIEPQKIDGSKFLSMGKSTPFDEWKVSTKCILTSTNGKLSYATDEVKKLINI